MKAFVASAVVGLALLSGCGGVDRPSEAAIAKTILDNTGQFSLLANSDDALEGDGSEIPEDTAKCAAKQIRESEVSDEGLKDLVENPNDYAFTSDDQKAMIDAQTTVSNECMGSGP